MMYADYAYYINTYHGREISERDFPYWAQQASDWIDYLTSGKADIAGAHSDKIKKACCAIAETAYVNETKGGGIISASNDGYSESYANSSNQQTAEQRVISVARRYLAGTGLLYRGVRGC